MSAKRIFLYLFFSFILFLFGFQLNPAPAEAGWDYVCVETTYDFDYCVRGHEEQVCTREEEVCETYECGTRDVCDEWGCWEEPAYCQSCHNECQEYGTTYVCDERGAEVCSRYEYRCTPESTTCGGWGECSKSCGGGSQGRDCTDSCSTWGEWQNCNEQSCCTPDWDCGYTGCSASCGGGTREFICHDRNGCFPDDSSGPQSCNTQSCSPSVPTPTPCSAYCPSNGSNCGGSNLCGGTCQICAGSCLGVNPPDCTECSSSQNGTQTCSGQINGSGADCTVSQSCNVTVGPVSCDCGASSGYTSVGCVPGAVCTGDLGGGCHYCVSPPQPTPPPGTGSCSSACGVCGFQNRDGSCVSDYSCCRATCQGSSCGLVFGSGSDTCASNASCGSYGPPPPPPPQPTATPTPAPPSIPPTPSTRSNLSCTPSDTSSMYTISWTGSNPQVSWVDISATPNFSSFWNKYVAGSTSTTASSGFSDGFTFQPNTNYYVRLWNGSRHSSPDSFRTPGVCPTPTPTPTPTPRSWLQTSGNVYVNQ